MCDQAIQRQKELDYSLTGQRKQNTLNNKWATVH